MCRQSKVASFRLQTAQRFLYSCGPSWFDMAQLLMRRVGCVGFAKQLFLMSSTAVLQLFPTLFVTPAAPEWQEGGGQLLSLTSPQVSGCRKRGTSLDLCLSP